MKRSRPKFDRRLLGTWKSDRRKTFLHYKPPANVTEEKVRKFKSLFGKLIIRWGKSKCSTDLNGYKESHPYEVVAADMTSVVIRYEHFLLGPGCLMQIHFDIEGDYYWIALDGGNLCEWFRKVK